MKTFGVQEVVSPRIISALHRWVVSFMTGPFYPAKILPTELDHSAGMPPPGIKLQILWSLVDIVQTNIIDHYLHKSCPRNEDVMGLRIPRDGRQGAERTDTQETMVTFVLWWLPNATKSVKAAQTSRCRDHHAGCGTSPRWTKVVRLLPWL